VLQQMIQMKSRISGLLMETGVSYDKQRRHKLDYFTELMSGNDEVKEYPAVVEASFRWARSE
jgi:transposase